MYKLSFSTDGDKPKRLLDQRILQIDIYQHSSEASNKTRPNGPAEPSPGLRPKADALG
jgi:hypothetical protein